jgi:hypothetical protein
MLRRLGNPVVPFRRRRINLARLYDQRDGAERRLSLAHTIGVVPRADRVPVICLSAYLTS